jgi:tetratricopeptide (TPR) repeat protein
MALLRAAFAHAADQEHHTALRFGERALRFASGASLAATHAALAMSALELGQRTEAERHARAAVQEPQQWLGWIMLARVFQLSQRSDRIIDALQRCLAVGKSTLPIDVRPHRPTLAGELGIAELLDHQADAAAAHLREALACDDVSNRAELERYLSLASSATTAVP